MERQELFVCQCGCASHQLILSTLDDEVEVYGTFHLDNYGLGRRIADAVKYALGIVRKDGDFDALLFNNEDAERLLAFADVLDGGSCEELPEFVPVVTKKMDAGREWKDTELYRWTFNSKDNTYVVTATESECLSSPELNGRKDVLICFSVWMKDAPFFKRIVRGVKHIFGYRSCYGDFDSFELAKDDAVHLRQLVRAAKKG